MTATAALPEVLQDQRKTLLPRPRHGVDDLAGLPVDCSGPVWHIHEATTGIVLDWLKVFIPSPTILEATADYVVSLICSRSPSHVRNAFETMKALARLPVFADQCRANTRDLSRTLDARPFFHARDDEPWPKIKLVHFRAWFAWCSTRAAPDRCRVRHQPSTRQTTRLLASDPTKLTYEERTFIDALCEAAPEVGITASHVPPFADLLRQDDPAGPESWLDAVAATRLCGFAVGLRQDVNAVRGAIMPPWSNGPVEGQVNRLKLIKRLMYGRAGFDLLQQRGLRAA